MNPHTCHDDTIVSLDLDAIKEKLTHRASGAGWTMARATAVESEYRRFLYLMKKFPGELTAPDLDVDNFWHHHILDTMKYAADCDQVFGYFLHHYPYLGMRGEADSAAQLGAGERMLELYEQTFGARRRMAASPDASCAAATGSAFCGATTSSAFCGAATTSTLYGAAPHTAFCGAAGTAVQPRAQADSAARGTSAQLAFCGAAGNPAGATTEVRAAFCGSAAASHAPMPTPASPRRPH